jgi:sugar/nucleoside kinase (ribokinase family)
MKVSKFVFFILIILFNHLAFSAQRTPEWNAGENDLLVVGQSIYDMVFKFDDDDQLKKYLRQFGMEIGDGGLINGDTANKIISELKPFYKSAGGSASNTAIGLVNLGKKVTFASVVGRDELGHIYENELKQYGIHTEFYFPEKISSEAGTGIVMVLLAPDGERTMLAYPGISKQRLASIVIDKKKLSTYKVIMSEGYLWDHPGNPEIISNIFDIAKQQGVHTAFTFGDKYIVEKYREQLLKLVSQIDILFCNEREVLALFETDNLDNAVNRLQKISPLAIVTLAEKGALIITADKIDHIQALDVKNVIDKTRAGDQFAAGFLYGYTNNQSFHKAGELGAKTAARIIQQFGAKPQAKWTKLQTSGPGRDQEH